AGRHPFGRVPADAVLPARFGDLHGIHDAVLSARAQAARALRMDGRVLSAASGTRPALPCRRRALFHAPLFVVRLAPAAWRAPLLRYCPTLAQLDTRRARGVAHHSMRPPGAYWPASGRHTAS